MAKTHRPLERINDLASTRERTNDLRRNHHTSAITALVNGSFRFVGRVTEAAGADDNGVQRFSVEIYQKSPRTTLGIVIPGCVVADNGAPGIEVGDWIVLDVPDTPDPALILSGTGGGGGAIGYEAAKVAWWMWNNAS